MSDAAPLPIGKHIDLLIKLALTDGLKAAGFKKQARTFRRRLADGSVQVIEIQSGKYNEGSQGEFTINLGLYLPAIAHMTGQALLEQPRACQCHIDDRIGHILPDRLCDYWWPIDSHTDDQALAADLRAAVMQHALSWLAAVAPAAFKAAGADESRLPQGRLPILNPLNRVSFYLLMDEPEKARQALRSGLENRPSLAEPLRALARRHGLPMD